MKKIYYLLSILLCCWYCTILFQSIDTSTVTDSYDIYYLSDGSYLLTDDETEQYKKTFVFFYNEQGNYKNIGSGWDSPEAVATWTIGAESSFFLYANETEIPYTLRIDIAQNVGYDNHLKVNDIKIADLPQENGCFDFVIPSGAIHAGFNRFSIETDNEIMPYNSIVPSSPDSRHLNLYIKSIAFFPGVSH